MTFEIIDTEQLVYNIQEMFICLFGNWLNISFLENEWWNPISSAGLVDIKCIKNMENGTVLIDYLSY